MKIARYVTSKLREIPTDRAAYTLTAIHAETHSAHFFIDVYDTDARGVWSLLVTVKRDFGHAYEKIETSVNVLFSTGGIFRSGPSLIFEVPARVKKAALGVAFAYNLTDFEERREGGEKRGDAIRFRWSRIKKEN